MSHEVAYGIHAVQALLDHHPHKVLQLFIANTPGSARVQSIAKRAMAQGIRVDSVTRNRLEQLCRSKAHQGAVCFVQSLPLASFTHARLTKILQSTPNAWFLLLDQIEDPQNFGAIIRTAAAAGVTAIIKPLRNAVGLTSTVRKVACGTADLIEILTVHNLNQTLRWFKQESVHVIGMDPQAQSLLYDARLPQPLAVVIGSEGSGMRQLVCDNCDTLYRLPMANGAQSLSASAATAITCFEIVRQRMAATH